MYVLHPFKACFPKRIHGCCPVDTHQAAKQQPALLNDLQTIFFTCIHTSPRAGRGWQGAVGRGWQGSACKGNTQSPNLRLCCPWLGSVYLTQSID